MIGFLLDEKLTRELALAKDYRDFLRLAIDACEKANGRGAKAMVSRKAGFASRSYLGEVINGKKGLSRDAVARLRGALKLIGPLAKLFENLVALDHPETLVRTLDPISLKAKIQNLRVELSQPAEKKKVASANLRNPQVFQIYAALGTEEKGASLQEIFSRTGISARAANEGLIHLLQSQAVVKKADRYFAVAAKADALRSTDDAAVSEMVQKVCASIQKNRQQIVADERSLSTYSAFSVRSERVADLRRSLEAAVFEVLDEFQDDSGDCVEQVFLSLFGKPLETV